MIERPLLVTGGGGFIGARVVERLHRQGHSVIVVDNGSVGLPLPASAPGLEIHQADIRDRTALDAIMAAARPARVVHLAAIHHIPTCTANPALALDVNILGTQSVLDAAARHGVTGVVVASSGAVYGWHPGPLAEHLPAEGQDTYALSKAANERQAAVWSSLTGQRVRIARIFNAVGPGDPNAHLIPDLLGRIATGRHQKGGVRLAIGNPGSRRDFINVEDIADALVLLTLDEEGEPVETFNICSGRELGVLDIVGLLADRVGISVETQVDPSLCRPIDRPSQLGDPQKMRGRFDWMAARGVAAAIDAILAADGRFS